MAFPRACEYLWPDGAIENVWSALEYDGNGIFFFY